MLREESPTAQAQRRLRDHLRGQRLDGFRFVKNASIPPITADFYCHSHNVAIWIRSPERQPLEEGWREAVRQKGVILLEIPGQDILQRTPQVLDRIRTALHENVPIVHLVTPRTLPTTLQMTMLPSESTDPTPEPDPTPDRLPEPAEQPPLPPSGYHLYSGARLLLHVVSADAEQVTAEVVGTSMQRCWKRSFFDNNTQPVHPEGLRVIEVTEPERLEGWLTRRDGALIVAMIRDEIAGGKDGLKRSTLNALLLDFFEGEALERAQGDFGRLLDSHPDVMRQGEGPSLVYIEVTPDRTQDRFLAAIEAMDILPVRPDLTEAELRAQAGRLLARARNFPDATALTAVGRMLTYGRAVLSSEHTEWCREALTEALEKKKAWRAFASVNAEAQLETLTHARRQTRIKALWDPGTKRETRQELLRQIAAEEHLKPIPDVEPGPEVEIDALIVAIDEAVSLAPLTIRPVIAEAAFSQLCRLPLLEPPALPGLSAALGPDPAMRLLGWAIAAAREPRTLRRENLQHWLTRLFPSSDATWQALSAVAIGARIQGSSAGLAQDLAELWTAAETESAAEHWLASLSEPVDIEAIAQLVCQPQPTPDRLEKARELSLILRRHRQWDQLLQYFQQAVRHLESVSQRHQDAMALAASEDNARFVLQGAAANITAASREDLEQEITQDYTEEIKRWKTEAATLLAKTLTTVQSTRLNVSDEALEKQLRYIEKRMTTLARRLGWELVGELFAEIEVDPAIHEVLGSGTGTPKLTQVGVRDRDGHMVLRAQIIRALE